jgi:hypothetical protein
MEKAIIKSQIRLRHLFLGGIIMSMPKYEMCVFRGAIQTYTGEVIETIRMCFTEDSRIYFTV